MKALIISDKQEIIDELFSYLKENEYDVIVYRWLIKALDNIEEIQPDLIVLSSSEYPRHWKTLASFVKSGIGGSSVKLFLYDPEPLSDEEKTKAQELGVEDYLDSLSDDQLKKIPSCIKAVIPSDSEQSVSIIENNYEIIITHPDTGKFIFGKAVSGENSDIYKCCFSSPVELSENQFIKFTSVYSNDQIKAFTSKVIECSDSTRYVLKVQNYYEEV